MIKEKNRKKVNIVLFLLLAIGAVLLTVGLSLETFDQTIVWNNYTFTFAESGNFFDRDTSGDSSVKVEGEHLVLSAVSVNGDLGAGFNSYDVLRLDNIDIRDISKIRFDWDMRATAGPRRSSYGSYTFYVSDGTNRKTFFGEAAQVVGDETAEVTVTEVGVLEVSMIPKPMELSVEQPWTLFIDVRAGAGGSTRTGAITNVVLKDLKFFGIDGAITENITDDDDGQKNNYVFISGISLLLIGLIGLGANNFGTLEKVLG